MVQKIKQKLSEKELIDIRFKKLSINKFNLDKKELKRQFDKLNIRKKRLLVKNIPWLMLIKNICILQEKRNNEYFN